MFKHNFDLIGFTYVLRFSDFNDLSRFHHRNIPFWCLNHWGKPIVFGPPAFEKHKKLKLNMFFECSISFSSTCTYSFVRFLLRTRLRAHVCFRLRVFVVNFVCGFISASASAFVYGFVLSSTCSFALSFACSLSFSFV